MSWIFIQKPVTEALDRYYQQETKNRLREAATEENTDPEKIKETSTSDRMN